MTTTRTRQPTTLAVVRRLMPNRPVTWTEALRVAEHQATKLLKLSGVTEAPVAAGVIADLPRVRVESRSNLGSSGLTVWTGGRWHIAVNATDSYARRRFTLGHEAKHLIDHPYVDTAYRRLRERLGDAAIERLCEYFAACLLMPKPWVVSQYCNRRMQNVAALARHFEVSQDAMRIRLHQLGLVEPVPRCGRYQRAGRPVSRPAQEVMAA